MTSGEKSLGLINKNIGLKLRQKLIRMAYRVLTWYAAFLRGRRMKKVAKRCVRDNNGRLYWIDESGTYRRAVK
jgi:hypothetical protein